MLARQQEVFAGFLTHTDAQIGRVLSSLEALGALDNTLVMVFSDNGASAEGGKAGSFNEHRFTAHVRESMDENLAHYDDWGGFTTYNHYSWAWAWAGNTPHKLWKRYTWLGGTRTPLIVHWPGRIARPGTVRAQFAHVIDLMPTIMGAAGLDIPDEVDGVAQQPVDGVSLLLHAGGPDHPRAPPDAVLRNDGLAVHLPRGVESDDQPHQLRGPRRRGARRRQPHLRRRPLGALRPLGGLLGGDRPRRRRARTAPTPARPVGRRGAPQQRPPHLRRPGRPLRGVHPSRLARRQRAHVPSRRWSRCRRIGSAPLGRLRHHGRHRHRRRPRRRGRLRPRRLVRRLCALPRRAAGPTSPSPGPPTRSSWRCRRSSAPAGTRSRSRTRSARAGAAGCLVLLVDALEVDQTTVEGMLPLAVQHGGAGLRLGWDSGFPVSSRYAPPAPFAGTVHEVRVETPGTLRPDPGDEVRAALHAD